MMLYQSVSSSCIAEIGYDSNNHILTVRFHGDREYRYIGVPKQTYHALLAACSIGRYFNAHVRDAFSHVPASQAP